MGALTSRERAALNEQRMALGTKLRNAQQRHREALDAYEAIPDSDPETKLAARERWIQSVQALETVLAKAREFIVCDLYDLIDCHTVHHPETGKPDRSTMDTTDLMIVEEIEIMLEQVDAALTAAGTPPEPLDPECLG